MRPLILIFLFAAAVFSQTPSIEPGVSHELAKWRAAHYSDVRYKLDLTLEKMSPVLKGTIEVRVSVRRGDAETGRHGDVSVPPAVAGGLTPIILDWRKIRGFEDRSHVSNVSINGKGLMSLSQFDPAGEDHDPDARRLVEAPGYEWRSEHLIFRDGVVAGENVIKLDFTSPILPTGSAITRYVDKEDGSEYIYSLFVPSDASTAFPVFDQPDLKARFKLFVSLKNLPARHVISNTPKLGEYVGKGSSSVEFSETSPISTYVFAFAAGNFVEQFEPGASGDKFSRTFYDDGTSIVYEPRKDFARVYVRQSQASKFESHAPEVFRLNREGVKFLETYFDYKFPFPKYDLVLIPEFPFGGMEHAGATFLRESSIIFPQEPTKNDLISRANLIFHEAAHQWFGDTVTMRWFDDLWLKEGFAEFMAYKTLEKVMPDANAWKVFYERNKQSAYLTDSTRGTTPIYQEIKNLSGAKSAYGNIVYRKAPSFLKQAEFYIEPQTFQTAVRAFLKKHEFANAGWEDLVKSFEKSSKQDLKAWADAWVKRPGVPKLRFGFGGTMFAYTTRGCITQTSLLVQQSSATGEHLAWPMKTKVFIKSDTWNYYEHKESITPNDFVSTALITGKSDSVDEGVSIGGSVESEERLNLIFPNYQDHGYGIFLLDDKSRDYVLKNIQNEKDDFLRSMMWGSLWDSVREGELDPKEYVELVLKVQSASFADDETTITTLLNRVSTAMTFYISEKQRDEIAPRLETMLLDRMQTATSKGLSVTFYRAFMQTAASPQAQSELKNLLATGALEPRKNKTDTAVGVSLRTKDRFDIVTRLIILNDPDAPKLLADLEKKETSDDAKRYAYAAKAGIATAENKAKLWADFTSNKEISESWIEAAFGPFNSVRHAGLTLPYLERALKELPNHKRDRKIFFVNGWLGAFIGGQRSEEALAIVNKFLADNPDLDRDLRLKILENVDVIERAVRIRGKFATR